MSNVNIVITSEDQKWPPITDGLSQEMPLYVFSYEPNASATDIGYVKCPNGTHQSLGNPDTPVDLQDAISEAVVACDSANL